MHNPILPVAIAFVLVAPCTALAQSPSLNFQKIEHEYKEQKPDGTARDPQSGLPTGQRMHKPLTVTKDVNPASPKATQNKPLTTTVNPALQGNIVLKPQKSDGSLDSAVKGQYDLKANKGR
jgi:hypothetical protein